jgi:hypothetical protein
MTYYIVPARYAISFSDRRYRSRNSINDALKLGRTPPFIYEVCYSDGTHIPIQGHVQDRF